ncbi:MAG: family transcriptional regulator [Candidatus Acidoferrum typicum]|nr:family transcriptional regulator [Candidatus Acidoferrum typicum]
MPGILIIDDSANIRRFLRSFVERNTPFTICGEAENAAEGIEKAKNLQPDLILFDSTLSAISGTEAASLFRKTLRAISPMLSDPKGY